MKPIVILGAMDEEVQRLKDETEVKSTTAWGYTQIIEGTLKGKSVVIAKCGVGKVLSSILAQHCIEKYQPQALLFTGVGGALNPNLEIGDIVVAKETMQHDMDASAVGFERGLVPFTDYRIISTDEKLRKLALSIKISGINIVEGRILSGDQFITHENPNRKILVEDLKGDLTEMEGAAVGLVCTIHKIPHLIVRSVSDKADHGSTVDFWEFMKGAAERSKKLILQMLEAM